jgi:hypothetical protein
VSILLASGRATFETSEKMNKKYVKHGIASVSTKSQKIKVNVLLTFKNHSSEFFLKK